MPLDILTSIEKAQIKRDVKDLMEDTDFRYKILYRRLASSSFNPSTGTTTPTWTEVAINAYRGDHSAREIAFSNGLLKVGDQFYVFDPALLSFVPRGDDRIWHNVTETGTVDVDNGATTVDGVATKAQAHGVQGGDILRIGAVDAVIKSVTSDLAFVLRTGWTGSNITNSAFAIYRIFENVNWLQDPIAASLKVSVRRAGS